MPLYEFSCSGCGAKIETYCSSFDEQIECKKCKIKMDRLLSAPRFKTATRGMFGESVMGEAEIGKDGSFTWKRLPKLGRKEIGSESQMLENRKRRKKQAELRKRGDKKTLIPMLQSEG